eukprot:7778763-Lingulodinium_polyedra.AAC.1
MPPEMMPRLFAILAATVRPWQCSWSAKQRQRSALPCSTESSCAESMAPGSPGCAGQPNGPTGPAVA